MRIQILILGFKGLTQYECPCERELQLNLMRLPIPWAHVNKHDKLSRRDKRFWELFDRQVRKLHNHGTPLSLENNVTCSVADQGERPHPPPPLFLDQTESRRPEKMFRGRPQAERTSGAWKVSGTRGILVLQDHANVVPITHTLFKERRTVYFFPFWTVFRLQLTKT